MNNNKGQYSSPYRHGEAFMLMGYQCMGRIDTGKPHQPGSGRMPRTGGCGHRETFWNSRDGVTPFGMGCPSCGGDLQHMNWGADIRAPSHQPHHGQGVWRDGTPDEAEAIMRKRIESCKGTPYECDDERTAMLVESARNPKKGEHSEFQKGWPMFYRHGMGE